MAKKPAAKTKAVRHFHFDREAHRSEAGNHPGGGRKHQHPSRGLVGYGRTRDTLKRPR